MAGEDAAGIAVNFTGHRYGALSRKVRGHINSHLTRGAD